jgi:hypothetical protein
MTRQQLIQLAKVGASIRLQQLRGEMTMLRQEFHLYEPRAPRASKPKRKPMSQAARRAISVRMREVWARKNGQ